jgi:hypothetical protein
MTERTNNQFDVITNHDYPDWISGFRLRNVLTSALSDLSFNQVITGLDNASTGLTPTCRSLRRDTITCADKLGINQDNALSFYDLPSFDEYASLHMMTYKSFIERGQTTIICSKQLTAVFEPNDICSLFIMNDNEIDLLIASDINKLNIILQLICSIRGIGKLPFPKVIRGTKNPLISFHRIFRRIIKCIQPNNSIYDDQIVCLRMHSKFYDILWGQYGIKAVSLLMTMLTSHLHSGILYDERLLATVFRRNLTFEIPIRIISVNRAFVSRGVAVPRFQFHLVLDLHIDPVANFGFPASSASIDVDYTTELGSISNEVQQLPVELKREIIKPSINLCNDNCMCDTINCNFNPHNSICKSRRVILDDTVNIMFPISFRTVTAPFNQQLNQIYVVYTTTLDGCKWFGDDGILSRGLLTGNKRDPKFKILNRLHFQGHVLDLNALTYEWLTITEEEDKPIFPKSSEDYRFGKNIYYHSKFPFQKTHMTCSHESEFVPQMHNSKWHYLLFD